MLSAAGRCLPWRTRVHCAIRLAAARQASITNRRLESTLTLAIETSCDDTSVAILSKTHSATSGRTLAHLHHHSRTTANNAAYRGIHPLNSLESHQRSLPCLVEESLIALPRATDGSPPETTIRTQDGLRRKPTFVTVTRGPGMRSSLSAGLDLAKGLCLAWGVPLVGAHHMQAHALTPRLVASMEAAKAEGWDGSSEIAEAGQGKDTELREPDFPFLTLLASGGHTLLLRSKSLVDHKQLGQSRDIAVGECLDKAARLILPPDIVDAAPNANYGALLESFAFPDLDPSNPARSTGYGYTPPANPKDLLKRRTTPFGWSLAPPLAEPKKKGMELDFSFTGLEASVRRILAARSSSNSSDSGDGLSAPGAAGVPLEERRELARELMRLAFEHLARRVGQALALQRSGAAGAEGAGDTLVLSGGVAANSFLKFVLKSLFPTLKLLTPPPSLCTDNAAMIAWAGIEMWDAGWRSDLACLPLKRWRMDESEAEIRVASEGDIKDEGVGILGVGGWERRW